MPTSPKRRLDDCHEGSDDSSELVFVRMRKDEETASPRSNSRLQFFVRVLSEGKTLVMQASPEEMVETIHNRIHFLTGIPVSEQRLIYKGKQLQLDKSLAECSIQNDAGLQLVGRMRSTHHPEAWQVMDDMISLIFRVCKGEAVSYYCNIIRDYMTNYLNMTPKDKFENAMEYLRIFNISSAPQALCMLYMSSIGGNKKSADSVITYFLSVSKIMLPENFHSLCAPIAFEFCKLLRKVGSDDPLYLACRTTLASMLDESGISQLKGSDGTKGGSIITALFPFVSELARRLSKDLLMSMDSPIAMGPAHADVSEFASFCLALRGAIVEQTGFGCPNLLPVCERDYKDNPVLTVEIELLYDVFRDLLGKMDKCLQRVEECLYSKGSKENVTIYYGWSHYLAILSELNSISKLYEGSEEQLRGVLRVRKAAVCALVLSYARQTDDHNWLLDYKDVTNFETRRHLAMMMFPVISEDYQSSLEMLIDRSQLLSESFEYIARADSKALHAGVFMEFKNEVATGPGVLREWFSLVCQAIFNQQNALFVACPNDQRRVYPNPASRVNPLHLEYFRFCGRVIALALMHRVQVGIAFDRSFFLQLAGRSVSLEDIQDTDPVFYDSCKKILEMGAEIVDSDALCLTFVSEIEELGSRRVVELIPDGKSIVVNSKNREKYVNFLLHHRFVASISEQVANFSRGFADVLTGSGFQKFFHSLDLQDLDWMLYGSESSISVEDWKAHTDYKGYKKTDRQILWFWEIVERMSSEQKKVLLFFWTSVKYLPVEGFRGLASRLAIYRASDPCDHLPSSHTCFYQLCFPPYPSMAVMQHSFQVITQEHVGCSFGSW